MSIPSGQPSVPRTQTARHLAEFWMIELEMAFMDLQGMLVLTEEFLRELLKEYLTGMKRSGLPAEDV